MIDDNNAPDNGSGGERTGCPNCGAPRAAGAADCPACGVIYEKWLRRAAAAAAQAGRTAPDAGTAREAGARLGAYRYPAAGAALAALVYSVNFRGFLPVTEGWALVEKLIFPLAYVTLAIHEAGHPLLGFFGNDFLMTAGGTLFQLAFPAAVLFHFLKRGEEAGCLFAVFWIGYSLVNVSFYMADAEIQGLILITGATGRESGMHDWNYMLGRLGLLRQAVTLGNLVFFAGVWGMIFAPLAAAGAVYRGFFTEKARLER